MCLYIFSVSVFCSISKSGRVDGGVKRDVAESQTIQLCLWRCRAVTRRGGGGGDAVGSRMRNKPEELASVFTIKMGNTSNVLAGCIFLSLHFKSSRVS